MSNSKQGLTSFAEPDGDSSNEHPFCNSQLEPSLAAASNLPAGGRKRKHVQSNVAEPHPSARPVAVEIFCGSARLSQALRFRDFVTIPFDKFSHKDAGLVVRLDLTTDEDEQSFWQLLQTFLVEYIHLAPPCGTSSRAREKPLSREHHGPRPLRTDGYPDGLSHLSALEHLRVQQANVLYKFSVKVALWCIQHSVIFSIENPVHSLMWSTSFFEPLWKHMLFMTIFDHCCHGGNRPKRTLWLSNSSCFESLAAFCPGTHEHLPWGLLQTEDGSSSFATAAETAYPHVLCQRVADCVSAILRRKYQIPDRMLDSLATAPPTKHKYNKLVLGFMVRGNSVLSLVSEFSHYEQVLVPLHHDIPHATRRIQVGEGSRVGLEVIDSSNCDTLQYVKDGSSHLIYNAPACGLHLVTRGVPRSADQFVQAAIEAGHPRQHKLDVPLFLKEVIEQNFNEQRFNLPAHRVKVLGMWLERCIALQSEEDKVKVGMTVERRQVLEKKRFKLFEEMLAHYEYPDQTLARSAVEGFHLVGWAERSYIFEPEIRAPKFSLDQLLQASKGLIPLAMSRQMPSDPDLHKAVWDKTMEEVNLGYISGPLDEDIIPGQHLVARRFGLLQGAARKLRLIDDFSEFGINGAYGSLEKPGVHGVDFILTILLEIMRSGSASGLRNVVGKTLDLTSAYKQYAISDASSDRVRLLVWCPVSSRYRVFRVHSLPFGATASVTSFLRISTAVWWLGVVALRISWSSYFDDYTIFSSADIATSTEKTAEVFLDLLGVLFARDGEKCLPFAKMFKALGVSFNLDKVSEGLALVGHTSSRKAELQCVIGEILSQGRISRASAESLRGRLIWAESYIFGRRANGAMRTIGKYVVGSDGPKLSDEMVMALLFIRDRLLEMRPVEIHSSLPEPCFLFTDGSLEDGVAGLGGVLVQPSEARYEFFSMSVPLEVLKFWFESSKNPIFHVELLAVCISFEVWKNRLAKRPLVVYVDNDAAKAAIVKGYTAVQGAEELCEHLTQVEEDQEIALWCARVPTASNIADEPSRFVTCNLVGKGYVEVVPDKQALSGVGIAGL